MGAIRNFGILWERKHIHWGQRGPGGQGTLLGYAAKSKSKRVDFRNQAGVYVLYDEKKEPVYVGQANAEHTLFKRLRDHTSDHLRSRWQYFSWFGMLEPGQAATGAAYVPLVLPKKIATQPKTPLKDELNEIEGILIQVLEPRLNKRGANWGGAEEYVQDTSNSLHWTLDESIEWAVSELNNRIELLHEDILKRLKK